MNISLQPIRIPAGWNVAYNGFGEIDPSEELSEESLSYFREDLLQLTCERQGLLLDLGWYPDGDISAGTYRIVVHVGDFRGQCLHTFASRERLTIVAEIERLLEAIVEGKR